MREHTPKASPLCPCGYPALTHRPEHQPRAWPICTCGAEAARHRVKGHKPVGDPCERCGIAASQHKRKVRKPGSHKYSHPYVGIDGEGVGRAPHKYILLCAVSITATRWKVYNPDGLTTVQCLDFILSLPSSRIFAYSFGYDLTKILVDLDNKTLYKLMRPSLRHRAGKRRLQGPKPVAWKGYKLNWLNGKFSVRKGKRQRTVWDVYKFYQSTFVTALERWEIGNPEYIQSMKVRRGQFDVTEIDEIRRYCMTECYYLAQLAKALLDTHTRIGLNLRSYYGPGSTASVALKQIGANELKGKHPEKMADPIARAFFGGRFEHSVIGPIPEKVYGYDISSAYPYQLYQLPCLKCGRWRYTTNEADVTTGQAALIRYAYRGHSSQLWAPFPVRDARGGICYPYQGEGWVWRAEYLAAKRIYKGVKFRGAWVYHTKCSCHPFAKVAEYYRERVNVGKDAVGIVLKLVINSIYGKLAQSMGINPLYQSWIWAGMVTSGTRAQILDLIAVVGPSNVLAIATDGVYTSKRIRRTPIPQDTGTYDLRNSKGELCPLGGWEEKTYKQGMFFVKPGIYFPLGDDENTSLRARGIGRKAMLDNRKRIVDAWEAGEDSLTIHTERFFGLKSCISRTMKRSKRYGEWLKVPIRVSFECPNRNEDMTLKSTDKMSFPYSKSMLSPEKVQALLEEVIEYEQPR